MNMQIKERPILFNPELAQAAKGGRKTQTRRMMKNQPTIDSQTGDWLFTYSDGSQEVSPIEAWINFQVKLHCPFGKPGDQLWVKENHFAFGYWYELEGEYTKNGMPKWGFMPCNSTPDNYKYTDNPPEIFLKSRDKKEPEKPQWYKRNSLFMPRYASRLILVITDVRVERLHDISEADAIAEGVEPDGPLGDMFHDYFDPTNTGGLMDAKSSFRSLWKYINGPESLAANPWVWVITFKNKYA